MFISVRGFTADDTTKVQNEKAAGIQSIISPPLMVHFSVDSVVLKYLSFSRLLKFPGFECGDPPGDHLYDPSAGRKKEAASSDSLGFIYSNKILLNTPTCAGRSRWAEEPNRNRYGSAVAQDLKIDCFTDLLSVE